MGNSLVWNICIEPTLRSHWVTFIKASLQPIANLRVPLHGRGGGSEPVNLKLKFTLVENHSRFQ